MAGDWIKIEKSTPRKPEVLHLCELLSVTPDEAFGLCFRFWSWCDDHLETGCASRVTEKMIDVALGRNGLASALIEVGWLQARNGSLVIPNFDRHLSESAKKRALSGKRMAKSRLRSSCADSVTKAQPEKRREEKSNTKTKNPPTPPEELLETPQVNEPPLPDSKSRDSPPPRIVPFAQPYDDQPDWLVVEAEFVAWWNSIPGVAKCYVNALPASVVPEFRERWWDPGWWERAQQCATKFPLQGHTTMSLRKFLKDTTIDEILGGVFDGLPDRPERKARTARTNGGQDAIDNVKRKFSAANIAQELQARELDEWAGGATG